MRAVRVHGLGDVRLDTVPDPVPGVADVLVRIHACGLCGTDLGYVARGGLAGPAPEPLALGHELSGVVESVGADVADIRVGDRVVVHPGNDDLGRIGSGASEGGLADLVLVRRAAGRLLKVPEGLDLSVAALTEPVAVGMHAVERLDLVAGSNAVVMGCGPIGLAAVATLVDRGVESVIAVDPSPARRRIAERLGAALALPPDDTLWREIRAAHGSHPRWPGATLTAGFVEASGSPGVLEQIIRRAAPRTRLSVPALHPQPVPVDFLMVMMKELEIHGSMEYPDRFEDALDLLVRKDLSPMLTDTVALEDVPGLLTDPAAMRRVGKTMALVAA